MYTNQYSHVDIEKIPEEPKLEKKKRKEKLKIK